MWGGDLIIGTCIMKGEIMNHDIVIMYGISTPKDFDKPEQPQQSEQWTETDVRNLKDKTEDAQSMIVFAFRYALGRATYAVGIVCDWIRYHYISDKTKDLIIKEISQAQKEDRMGMDIDKEQWLALKYYLENGVIDNNV